ncbi:MAG: CcmD family protein [Chitinophagaceae bacterium]
MDKLKRIGFLIVFCMINCFAFAQQQIDTTQEEPTDFMRSNGKIYVVIAVVVVIVLGIFIYLFNLDRKIKGLEKENKSTSLGGRTTKQSVD